MYKQSTTRNWYSKFFTEGKYKVTSLGTTHFNTAKESALDWYDELRFSQKHGVPVHGIKFKEIIEPFDKYQQVQVKSGELTPQLYKDYRIKLEGPIRRYFKNHLVQDIQLKQLNEFRVYRIDTDGLKHTSVTHDFVVIRLLLKYCLLQDFIKSLPEFPRKSKKEKPNPRPWFNFDEWEILKQKSRERIKLSRSVRTRHDRQQLHDFMVWMVHTGMRVSETLSTRFMDVEIKEKGKSPFETRIKIQGKTGYRVARGLIGSVRAYQRIGKRNPDHKETDLLFPHHHKDGLNELLKSCDLKRDNHGRVRNAKSFRSTFIMYRLIAKRNLKEIETNCGTSATTIRKYYAKFLDVDMYDDSFTDLPSDMDND
tara:strand:- start:250 stop:1350 length:1101 start_codon:yes stop_codon:yes gene_type:complete